MDPKHVTYHLETPTLYAFWNEIAGERTNTAVLTNWSYRSSYQVLASLNFPKPTLCPEKDTTDPERETKKGSKGSKPPIKRSKRIAHGLIDSANHLLEAGKKHSTRQTRRTVFDAARIALS